MVLVAKRLLQGAVVVFAVTVVVFIITRVTVDPASRMLPIDVSDAAYESFRRQFGLDRSLIDQFVSFLAGALTLDFGQSLTTGEDVLTAIVTRFPATVLLVTMAGIVALILAVPLGIQAARRPGGLWDRFVENLASLWLSLPEFWFGAVLITVFAVQLGILPTSGRRSWDSAVLPAVTLALPVAGRLALVVRTSVRDQLDERYVLAAAARGLGDDAILRRHVLRNATAPVLSVTGLELIRMLSGGAVIVEAVFAWPGLGELALRAIRQGDVFLIEGIVFFTAVLIVLFNLVTDSLQGRVDPRIELAVSR